MNCFGGCIKKIEDTVIEQIDTMLPVLEDRIMKIFETKIIPLIENKIKEGKTVDFNDIVTEIKESVLESVTEVTELI